MQFCFFGTDDFSLIVLNELAEAGFLPSLIITPPDRPKGRGLKLSLPLVKEWAIKNNIPFLQPALLDSSFTAQLAPYNLQLFVVASYGFLIPKEVLKMPKQGVLNVHPSLLPKYRGAAPIESQILAGEKEIGVTIMLMDEKMDHGPIVAAQRLEITNHNVQITNNNQISNTQTPNASTLRKELAHGGGKLLAEVMPKWVAGEIKSVPQDEAKATYTQKFTKADGEIDLAGDPYKNFLKIRAFDDTIGTYFFFSPSPLFKRRQKEVAQKTIRVLVKDAEFTNGKLILTRVIPEGRREMSYEEFLCGFHSA